MLDKRLLILNPTQIQQKIDRIAYQVLEDNFDEQEIIIAGILPQGSNIAARLKAILDTIAPFKTSLINIELDKHGTSLSFKLDTPIEVCTNKAVIIVDDVMNSGKTLAYGFGVFLDVPLKKLRTVVLVDRNHKSFPISTDYAGIALSTLLNEHVEVSLSPTGDNDAVYLG